MKTSEFGASLVYTAKKKKKKKKKSPGLQGLFSETPMSKKSTPFKKEILLG
jgi:hypothetical protein